MSRRRSTIALTATLAITAATLVAGGGAPAGAAAEEAQACTLPSGAHRSEHDEWGSCLSVDASLSAAPAIGQTATLTYEITAAVARPDATVKIELPDGLEFDSAPDGATLATGTQSDGTGAATFARTTVDLAAGTTTSSAPVSAQRRRASSRSP